MSSLNDNYLKSLTFSSEEIATLRMVGEYKGKQELFFRQSPEVLKSLQQTAIIESNESSNRLEGITAPHHRIAELALKDTQPKNRSEQEIAGYRDALALIHESGANINFTPNVILQIHSIIYRYMPDLGGRFKMTDNEIVEKDESGHVVRVRFKPVAAFKTPEAMEEMVRYYHEAIHAFQSEPLILIPLAILDFLCIHPFRDGNGRTARLLTLMLLYHFDYRVGRYISLERVFEDSKETYYESLEASSRNWHQQKQDVHPWLNYFWGTLLRAYREFEERVGTIQGGRGSKTGKIRAAVERRINPFAISDIESDCPGTSRDMIRLVLRQLKGEKAIKLQGKGRGSKWVKTPTT